MTSDIIEIIIFLIPGFLCFEIFYPLSGIEINLSDKKYYFICILISFFVYSLYGFISGIRYVQELDSRLLEIKTVFIIYIMCIVVSFISANLVRRHYYPNYCLLLREPWSTFLEEHNKDEASDVIVITSDGSEYYGKLKTFAHKKNEQREIVLENVSRIIRNEKMEPTQIDLDEKEILFTKDDIRRIVYHKSTRKDESSWVERNLHIKR